MIVRLLFPVMALCIAALSIAVDLSGLPGDHVMCVRGWCRYDQVYSSIDARGATSRTLAALVEEDPSNPHAWATYAEQLATSGNDAAAEQAFARALTLGAGLAPVLMRAANFDFTHDRIAEGLALVPRILDKTAEYDEILFSYLRLSGPPAVQAFMAADSPLSPRGARAWLTWTLTNSSPAEIAAVWGWILRRGFADEKSAEQTANALWQGRAYGDAQRAWVDWLGPRAGGYPHTLLLANDRFEAAPSPIPFDWDLSSRAGLEYSRRDGLEVRFTGHENLTDAGVRQYTVVAPGEYRLTADVSAADISTDQGVSVEIADADDPARVLGHVGPFLGTRSRSTTTVDVTIPRGTNAVRVQLMRKESLKFDNKLTGVLHIHRLALEPR
jgi:hypothetical protein